MPSYREFKARNGPIHFEYGCHFNAAEIYEGRPPGAMVSRQ
jgi:hypothetical protein